jgi:Na+-translocating ferredoxin:NAD+ oxidoreductase RnfA subunit
MASRQPYERSSKLSRNEIIFNNFLGGIAWALGATIGLSLIFIILGHLAKEVNLVPVVGSFVSQVINYILATNPNVHH